MLKFLYLLGRLCLATMSSWNATLWYQPSLCGVCGGHMACKTSTSHHFHGTVGHVNISMQHT